MSRTDQEMAHEKIIDALAAFLDEELLPEEMARIEAHLVGCARCRSDLALQRELRERLAAVPAARAPAKLRTRIAETIGEGPAQSGTAHARKSASHWTRGFLRTPSPLARTFPWLGWAVAASLALALVLNRPVHPPDMQSAASKVPMIVEAVSNYRTVVGRELPLTYPPELVEALSEAFPFPIATLASHEARLLGAWRVEVRGEPAAALAYRVGNDVVIQYVVSEALFFRQPLVREAVAREGRYATTDGAQGVVAWPGAGSGSLIIGDLPTERLEQLVI